jgi:hypothetical protein
MAIRNIRIDSSHSPFKRAAELGPGPKKKSRSLQLDWECKKKAKPKKGTYQQVCKYVGPIKAKRGTKRVITVKKKAKAEYNETYENWLKKRGGKPRFRNVVRKGYKARRALLKGGR